MADQAVGSLITKSNYTTAIASYDGGVLSSTVNTNRVYGYSYSKESESFVLEKSIPTPHNVTALAVNGNILATGGSDNTVYTYVLSDYAQEDRDDTRSGELLVTLSSEITHLQFSQFNNGNLLAVCSRSPVIQLIDLENKDVVQLESTMPFLSCCIDPQGTYLAAVSVDGTLVIWHNLLSKGPTVVQTIPHAVSQEASNRWAKVCNDRVLPLSIDWYPQGKHLILPSNSKNKIHILPRDNFKKPIVVNNDAFGHPYILKYSPNGLYLLVISADDVLILSLDPETNAIKTGNLVYHQTLDVAVTAADWSLNSDVIFLAKENGTFVPLKVDVTVGSTYKLSDNEALEEEKTLEDLTLNLVKTKLFRAMRSSFSNFPRSELRRVLDLVIAATPRPVTGANFIPLFEECSSNLLDSAYAEYRQQPILNHAAEIQPVSNHVPRRWENVLPDNFRLNIPSHLILELTDAVNTTSAKQRKIVMTQALKGITHYVANVCFVQRKTCYYKNMNKIPELLQEELGSLLDEEEILNLYSKVKHRRDYVMKSTASKYKHVWEAEKNYKNLQFGTPQKESPAKQKRKRQPKTPEPQTAPSTSTSSGQRKTTPRTTNNSKKSLEKKEHIVEESDAESSEGTESDSEGRSPKRAKPSTPTAEDIATIPEAMETGDDTNENTESIRTIEYLATAPKIEKSATITPTCAKCHGELSVAQQRCPNCFVVMCDKCECTCQNDDVVIVEELHEQ